MATRTQKKVHLERNPAVRFFVRFCPTEDPVKDWKHIVAGNDGKTIFVRAIQDMKRLHPMWTYWQFITDGMMKEINQDALYRTILSSRLSYACEGVDLVVLAFGEPGSGKSYTMTGLNDSYANRGLIPRTLEELLGSRRPKEYNLRISITYVEFWENKCYNLLGGSKKPVEVNPATVKLIEVTSSDEGLDLLFRGEVKRKFEQVYFNCGSSVFTIHVQSHSLKYTDPNLAISKIHFVDLAGVENIWKAQKSDPCTISANLDKLSVDVTSRWAYYLAKAIARPSDRKNTAVFGSSSLVSYLERSFTHGFVSLLGMVKPSGKLENSLSTLRFGCKVARLHTGMMERHQKISSSRRTAFLKKEIEDLKTQIETSKLLSFGEYDRFNVCQGEAQHIERLIKSYLRSNAPNGVSETCLLSTAKPYLLLEEIRRQFQVESDFITTHFRKVSAPVARVSSKSLVDETEKKSIAHKKKKSRASITSLLESTHTKDGTGTIKDYDKDSRTISKSMQGRKSKSASSRKSRKSVAAQKPKVVKAPKGKPKRKTSPAKIEPTLAPIDKEFLDKGRRDKFWLMNEFLLRNKDIDEEKKANDSLYETTRDEKILKTNDLDELRASLGRTKIALYDLQSKRNHLMSEVLADPGPPSEEEKSLIDKEKATKDQISKVIEELVKLHGMLSEATQTVKTFEEKLQARFKEWIDEIYADEPLDEEDEPVNLKHLDKEIPKQTILPFERQETESELDFLKLQSSIFKKKLPLMPIINE